MGSDKAAEIGDFVFAKVRGYPAWPAKIVAVLDPRPATLKYTVFFYGTSETATVQAKEVFPYLSNKEKFGKPIKRKFFNEGIEELEKEMKKAANGDKSAKDVKENEGGNSEPVKKPKVTSGEKDETATPDGKAVKRSRESEAEDSVSAKRKRKSSSVAPPDIVKDKPTASGTNAEEKEKKSQGTAEGRKRRASSAAPSSVREKETPTEEKKSEVSGRRRKGSSATPAADSGKEAAASETPREEKESKSQGDEESGGRKRKRSNVSESADLNQSKEQTSRSGRVIKPKKFLYDEEEKEDGEQPKTKLKSPEPSDKSPKIKEEPVTPKKATKEKAVNAKGGKNKESAVKNKENSEAAAAEEEEKEKEEEEVFSPKLAALGRVMWARSKSGQVVQVKVDHDRPTAFSDDKSRLQWERSYEQHLKKVKRKIESGEALPEDVTIQLQPTPEKLPTMTEDQIHLCKKLRLLERKRGKMRWLRLETRLVDIDMLLRICLQKTKVNVEKALQLMDELINLPMDPLMLKKHPQLVDTVRKLRQYTGNVRSWNLSSVDEEIFKKHAKKIRQKANTLLNRFRSLFAVSKPEDFMNIFLHSVQDFKNLTKDLPSARVYSLIIDPSSPYYKEISEYDDEDEEFGREIMKNACLAEKEALKLDA